jgi:hypothetical protein
MPADSGGRLGPEAQGETASMLHQCCRGASMLHRCCFPVGAGVDPDRRAGLAGRVRRMGHLGMAGPQPQATGPYVPHHMTTNGRAMARNVGRPGIAAMAISGTPLHSREPFDDVFPGQWGGVSLPACQQQVLDGIESDLESCEPGLRSMFAIFTRLTRDEGAPRTELLRPASRRHRTRPGGRRAGTLRAVVAVSLLLGLVTLLVFLAINSSASGGCRPRTESLTATTALTGTCQSALESYGRP